MVKLNQKMRKAIGAPNPYEMWKLVKESYQEDRYGNLVLDENNKPIQIKTNFYYIVNSETGRIQEFQETDSYVSESIRDGTITTNGYFASNGFIRMRLAEEGLKEAEKEDNAE